MSTATCNMISQRENEIKPQYNSKFHLCCSVLGLDDAKSLPALRVSAL